MTQDSITPKQEARNLIISHMTLRQIIGWLGILLPVIVVIFNIILCCCSPVQGSISDYYYTRSGDFLVGILWVLAFFLFSYKGHDSIDDLISNFAGAFALGVACFPTTYKGTAGCLHHEVYCCSSIGIIHLASALLLFVSFAYMSLCRFTKTNIEKKELRTSPHHKPKRRRNRVFKTCGILIFVFIGLMVINHWVHPEWLQRNKPTLILETLSLCTFGFSWLVKGQLILKDIENNIEGAKLDSKD